MTTEEDTETTATTPISEATQTSLHSPHENEVDTECQRSLDPFYMEGYYIKGVKTFI